MEDRAIKDGFAHLKPGQTTTACISRLFAGRRRIGWWGSTPHGFSPSLYHKTLTVGRVQTPTLKMLVDRESQIGNFKKEKYHVVHIAAGGMEAASDRFTSPDDAGGG